MGPIFKIVLSLTLMLALMNTLGAVQRTALAADGEGYTELKARPDMPVSIPLADPSGAILPHHGTDPGTASCDNDINRAGRIYNLSFISAYSNGRCANTDLDSYQTPTGSYVIESGKGLAYTHYNVTDPARPVMVRKQYWAPSGNAATNTMDAKAFRQADRYYVALTLERAGSAGYCGLVIMDVTVPSSPVLKSQTSGSNWCDSHNVFVESDSHGDAAYLYVAANYTRDMRVLDISGKYGGSVAQPRQVASYRHPSADPYGTGYGRVWVHDITVVDHGGSIGRRVYVAYWYGGVIVLRATDGSTGVNLQVLTGAGKLDPSTAFRAHHAVPNAAGTRLFVQDEFLYSTYDQPVQMWDITSVSSPRKLSGLRASVGVNGQYLPAHNLMVIGNTLYLAWYKAGLQAWRINTWGFGARVAYHQVQTEVADADYDGSWGISSGVIGGRRYLFQSDQRYGLITSAPRDDVAPDTAITSGPAGTVGTTTAIFTFASSETGAFACSFDGSPYAACSPSLRYDNLASGSHTLRTRAADRYGNADPTPAGRTWTVRTAASGGPLNINNGATHTRYTGVTLYLSAATASQMRFRNAGGQWSAWEPYAVSKPWTLATGEGSRTVYAELRDGTGVVSPAADTVVLDTQAPATTAPRAKMTQDAAMGTDAVPVSLAWTANDAASPIVGYQLQQRVNGSAYEDVSLGTPAGARRMLHAGYAYQFRARALDQAGNWSAWSYSAAVRPVSHQENSATVKYNTAQTRVYLASAFGQHLKYTSKAGATSSLTFAGRGVAWIAPRAPNRGRAAVYIDGVRAATVDLYAASMQPRRVVFSREVSASVSHTIQVRVLGTRSAASSGVRVDLDAFVVLK